MEDKNKKTLGHAIDEIIASLANLDEQSRIIAIQAACNYLKITISNEVLVGDNNLQTKLQTPSEDKKIIKQIIDIKTLKEEKKPTTAIEMTCLVAYYLENYSTESEKKSNITTIDLEKYFKQASYPLPKVPKQALIDAKSAGYFDSVGKGLYKLNPVGYNLVAHKLPKKNK